VFAVNPGLIGIDRCLVLVPEAPPLGVEAPPLGIETDYTITVVRNLLHVYTTNDEVGFQTNDVMTGNVLGPRTDCTPRGQY